jgi:chemotaxis protein MotB
MHFSRSRYHNNTSTAESSVWPGFVDAFSALLAVIVFVLLIFVLLNESSQVALSARDKDIQNLTKRVNSLLIALNLSDNDRVKLEQQLASLTTEHEQLIEKNQLLNTKLITASQDITSLKALNEDAIRAKDLEIATINAKLNQALEEKLKTLANYRSVFLGKLRKVLADKQNIKIEGDRFIFQSEVLFPLGSSTMEEQGTKQIKQLAQTLKEIMPQIPQDINWVLRVDGHTDSLAIKESSNFQDNWELSTERSLSVVRELIREGIPASRLVATGFGEHQPITNNRFDDASLRKNRRIEFKLTTK